MRNIFINRNVGQTRKNRLPFGGGASQFGTARNPDLHHNQSDEVLREAKARSRASENPRSRREVN